VQGVAAKNDASYDLSRARASVTGQTTIAASPATTSLNGRIVMALFAGALLLSAFLLFVLEPMVAKSILPTLGGTPMAWNTRLRGTEVVDLVEAGGEACSRCLNALLDEFSILSDRAQLSRDCGDRSLSYPWAAGLPVGDCGIDRVFACGAKHCYHVAVEVQPLHTN